VRGVSWARRRLRRDLLLYADALLALHALKQLDVVTRRWFRISTTLPPPTVSPGPTAV
jgi:hypothetical protein